MTAPIVLHVVGLPFPQGSKTRMPNGAMVDGNSARARAGLGSWRRAVADAGRAWLAEHPGEPITEPVAVELFFLFAQSKSDPYRTHHATKPDLDKLARAVADSLKHAGLLADDSLICRLVAGKAYCGPGDTVGCTITVDLLGDEERRIRAMKKACAAEARRKRPAVQPELVA